MGETANLGLEFLILSLCEFRLCDFLLLPAEHIQTLGDLRIFLRTHLTLFRPRLPVPIDILIGTQTLREIGITAFKKAALRLLAQECQVLVLSMDVHEMRRKFFEKGQRHMGTVDKNGAFPRT